MTLIEVVAAIAILGTVLVGVVIAKSRHTRQIARAQRTHAAVRAADDLIASWWLSAEGVPIGAHGVIEADHTLAWRTRLIDNAAVLRLGAQVVRVEVRDAATSPAAQESADMHALEADKPLVVVELLLPDPAVVNIEAADDQANPSAGVDRREPGRSTTPSNGGRP